MTKGDFSFLHYADLTQVRKDNSLGYCFHYKLSTLQSGSVPFRKVIEKCSGNMAASRERVVSVVHSFSFIRIYTL